MKLNHWFVAAVLSCTALMSCSDDDPAAPLTPPTVEQSIPDAVSVNNVNYNMYIGGDVIAKGVANYYVMLSNAKCELDERNTPTPVSNGDLVALDLYATTSSAGQVTLPQGVYNFGWGHRPFTFSVDNTLIIRNRDARIWSEAVVGGTVEVKEAEGTLQINCQLELASGEVACYNYTGELKFQDITDTWGANSTLKVDMIDTPFNSVWAAYYGNMFETGTGNFMLYFYTDGYADNMSQQGSMLALCMFSNLASQSSKATLTEGDYTVVPLTDGYGKKNTLMGGMPISGKPFGTYIQKTDADTYVTYGFITGGTVKVKKTDKGYKFEYNLLTDNRKKVQGTFESQVSIEDQSNDHENAFISNLNGDVNTELKNVKEGTWTWKGEITGAGNKKLDLWSIWLQAAQGDAMVFELATEPGLKGQIPDGTYTTKSHLSEPSFSTQTAVAGHLVNGSQRGCWYLHFKEGKNETTNQNYYYVMDLNAPAIEEGTVTVRKQADGHYSFTWKLVDDSPAKNKITGSWTGPLRAYNPNKDGALTVWQDRRVDAAWVRNQVNERVFKLTKSQL